MDAITTEDNRKYDVGTVIKTPVGHLECTAVRYTENDEGERAGFHYTFRDQDEIADEKALANPSEPVLR
jgi:hypothetical protein